MADRAIQASGRDPGAFLAFEEEVLHLGGDEDRRAAQRILLRAQDAHRMSLPGAHTGFVWIGCLRLIVAFLDGRDEHLQEPSNTLTSTEARQLWRLLDEHVRGLSKEAYIRTDEPRPGFPHWPGVVLHSTTLCTGDTRTWISFHCVTNTSTSALSDFSVEGGVQPGPLMVCAAIPDMGMRVEALQDPARTIAQTPYSLELRRCLDSALQQAMAEMPHLELRFEGDWGRMSTLVEEGVAEGAASALALRLGHFRGRSTAQSVERIRSAFPDGLELVCGSFRTEHPTPAQAVTLALYGARGGRIVTAAFAAALPGTVLSDVAQAANATLTKMGLPAKTVVLEPRAPVQRLSTTTFVFPCVDGRYRSSSVAYFGKCAWGFKNFDWESGWSLDGPSFQSDDAIRRLGQLPHPIAMQVAGVEGALAAHYEPALLSALDVQMRVPGRSNDEAIKHMMADDPDLRELDAMQHDQAMHFDTDWYAPADGISPPAGVYCAAHWKRVGGVLMVARRSLMDRLEETSIEKGFPLKSLKLPYPDLYVHFEKPLKHQRKDGLSFNLTGFYASEEEVNDGSGGRRLTLTYTYLYDTEVMRIGGLDVTLSIEADDERDLTEVVADRRSSINSAASKLSPDDSGSLLFTNDTLVTAAKVVLYTTLKNARMVEVRDRGQLVEQLRNVKGSKRDKIRGRITQAFDYVAIGPEDSQDSDGAAELRAARALEAHGIKPHWRRGFYRMQRHGVGRSLSHEIWIPPVLVNGHLVDGAPPVRKDYFLD